jgi:hypothetical protein
MTYRFYFVGVDGHFKRASEIDCASDADALAVAETLAGRRAGIEVWERARFIARIEGALVE